MANKGILDKKMGIDEIQREIKKLSELIIKVGILESTTAPDGTSVAEYTAYNEYGVPGKKKKWNIPPRPFIRTAVDNNMSTINQTIEKYYKIVTLGKMKADVAASVL